MRLFHILTRRVDTGKVKVSQKLLDRVCPEVGGKVSSKPKKVRRRQRGGFTQSFCVMVMAALTLPICLVNAQATTGTQPRKSSATTSGYSAAALFNQANADARKGKTGPAILNYERALLLSPNDADIAANLHFVRAKAGLPDVPENWLTRTLNFAPPNTLAWLGSFGLVAAGISLFLGHYYPRRRLAFRSVTFGGALLVATAIGSAITLWPRVDESVIIVRETPARTSPVLAAEPAFKLREGETVTELAEHQDFVLVQTPADRSGWVARHDLTHVVPRSTGGSPSTDRT